MTRPDLAPLMCEKSYINSIPDEVLRAIIESGKLRAQEIGLLSCTCRRLSHFFGKESHEVWTRIATDSFPKLSPMTQQLEAAAAEGRGDDVRATYKDMCTRLPCRYHICSPPQLRCCSGKLFSVCIQQTIRLCNWFADSGFVVRFTSLAILRGAVGILVCSSVATG
mmetsp:Transcript_33318/g.68792  ORF Transcript_33318/g.68792 Transcript_33318/m.68792 type:complete len:166 (+) Transcript_33318:87-584(+)